MITLRWRRVGLRPGRQHLLLAVAVLLLIVASAEFVLLASREHQLVDRFSDSTWWMASQFRAEIQQLHISLASYDGSAEALDDIRNHYDIVAGRIASVDEAKLEPRPEAAFLAAMRAVSAGASALGARIDAIRQGDIAAARAIVSDMPALEVAAGYMTTQGAQTDAGHRGAVRVAVERANVVFALTLLLLIASLLLSLRAVQRQAQGLDAARRRSEALGGELTAALAQAEAGARAKSAFLATMSHEIRTPMNGILGAASLLSHTPLADDQRRWVEIVTASGEALLAQLDDVLDFSALEADAVTLLREPVDVRALAEATARLVEGAAAAKGLDLVVVVDPDVPGNIVSDRRRLRQVWLNLLTNAVKFTPAGGVVLRVSLRRRGGNAWLRAAVADSGPGIPRADRRRVFTEFTRLERPGERTVRGTGLGLAICRRIVAALRGALHVTGAPGGGSLFWMTIPVGVEAGADGVARRIVVGTAGVVGGTPAVRSALGQLLAAEGFAMRRADSGVLDLLLVHAGLAAEGLPRAAIRRVAFGPGTALDAPVTGARLRAVIAGGPVAAPSILPDALPRGASLRLLVADDDAINREIAASLLGHLGHMVTAVSDGAAALAAARETKFDCILLDLHMPGLDGADLARTLRLLPPPVSATRLVAVTADADAAARGAMTAAGFDAILVKPVTLERLAAALPQAAVPAEYAPTPAPDPTAVFPVVDTAVRGALAVRLAPARLAALIATFWAEVGRMVSLPDAFVGADGERRLHTLIGSTGSLGYAEAAAAARRARGAMARPVEQGPALSALSAALLRALRADAALLPPDRVSDLLGQFAARPAHADATVLP